MRAAPTIYRETEWEMRDLWFLCFRDRREGGKRERGMEIERDSRCCEALPSYCLSSLCLIGLLTPSPPPPPSPLLPSLLLFPPFHPPLPAVTRAMGRQPWRLLVLPLLLPLLTPPPLLSLLPDWPRRGCVSPLGEREEGREAMRRSNRF